MFTKLTNQIKEFFIENPNNDFIEKLKKYYHIESIEVYPDEDDDPEVLVIFSEEQRSLSSIIFSDGYANVEYTFMNTFINIPFYYYSSYKETMKYTTISYGLELLGSNFNYEQKGMQILFDDIMSFIESILDDEIYIEYIDRKNDEEDPNLKKCRIYKLPNQTIAQSVKWKNKYSASKKLHKILL